MPSYASNKIKFLLATKAIDFSADTFKIILMASGFSFNRDTHHGYADVSSSELAEGNGYLRGDKVLTGIAVVENDSTDRLEVSWNNATWTASGGSIGPTPGAIIIDDTVTAPTADPIIGYIDFGGNMSQADGGVGSIANITFRIA